MAKKKKNNNTPRRKRMTREQRLQSAMSTDFPKKSAGMNIVRHYANWYGVDLLCAIAELRVLGLDISAEYEEAVRNSINAKLQARRQTKQKCLDDELTDSDSDDTFAYIIGYTSGGAPYGVRWEEIENCQCGCGDQ